MGKWGGNATPARLTDLFILPACASLSLLTKWGGCHAQHDGWGFAELNIGVIATPPCPPQNLGRERVHFTGMKISMRLFSLSASKPGP
jgi:hypothetical protein